MAVTTYEARLVDLRAVPDMQNAPWTQLTDDDGEPFVGDDPERVRAEVVEYFGESHNWNQQDKHAVVIAKIDVTYLPL